MHRRGGRAPVEGPELGQPVLGPALPPFFRPHLALCEVTFSRKPAGCGLPPVSALWPQSPSDGAMVGNRLRDVI